MVTLNEPVLLTDSKNRRYLVKVTGNMELVPNLGVIDTGPISRLEIGSRIKIEGFEFVMVKPNVEDLLRAMRREAQIISVKDMAAIILKCNIKNGALVIEGGVGSGFLSIAILNYIRPEGRLVSYELREDFAEIAKNNVSKTGLEKYWTLKIEDIKNVEEKDTDSVVLDIPEPWTVVERITDTLKSSGWFCAYLPTVSQVEKTANKLKEFKFVDIEVKEILERRWYIGQLGSRPETNMLGHTGFLVFARKL